ncbi:hypothetical protein MNR02_16175 [Shinella sp. H4-D48]|uniref:hypothetical protein n=1 Tax=Shinella sp. H4-D48 TaxID=2925841 RepID=UPI001F5303F5|nr:hypothetical protein [Shinella sp. H4-D48]UNK37966.1 hypothetical protein MNR02_16175 [Shinella sp. H4-D48]
MAGLDSGRRIRPDIWLGKTDQAVGYGPVPAAAAGSHSRKGPMPRNRPSLDSHLLRGTRPADGRPFPRGGAFRGATTMEYRAFAHYGKTDYAAAVIDPGGHYIEAVRQEPA